MRSETRPAWLEPAENGGRSGAAAIVAGALLRLAAVLGLIGRNQVNRATSPILDAALESGKSDIDVVEERARR
ncbi:phage holin family protein [Nonomuraea sp. NPDC049152]|uniref:phage holin family protein n=1 Tax=Nonomuraea sp. NPDC049152 TaxID=3154350 RepID=UPI0033F7EE8A